MAGLESVERKNGRRGFIVRTGLFIVGGLTALATTPPKLHLSGNADGYKIYQGWIEDKTTHSFITLREGYQPWLKDVIFENEIILDITKHFVSYFNESRRRGNRLLLGDFLTYTFEHTYEVLNKLPSDQKEPDINIRLEAAHATLIALMGATNPKWEAVEWRKLGGEIPEDGSILDDFEGKNGLNKVVFPSILSTGEQSDREGHFRHFIHSAGIAFERGYAKLFGLAEYRTIPIGPQLWAQIVKPFYKDYETEAVKVADILGKAHELVSTFRKNSIPLIQTPSEGIFDPNVGGDLAVNILGARFGARVLSILQMTPFARLRYLLLLRKELNDPKFEKLSDGAILETATPKATKGFLLRILSPLEVRG